MPLHSLPAMDGLQSCCGGRGPHGPKITKGAGLVRALSASWPPAISAATVGLSLDDLARRKISRRRRADARPQARAELSHAGQFTKNRLGPDRRRRAAVCREPAGLTPKQAMDIASLAELLHETSERHGSFRGCRPPHDWWDWYAAYIEHTPGGGRPGRCLRRRQSLHGGGRGSSSRRPDGVLQLAIGGSGAGRAGGLCHLAAQRLQCVRVDLGEGRERLDRVVQHVEWHRPRIASVACWSHSPASGERVGAGQPLTVAEQRQEAVDSA